MTDTRPTAALPTASEDPRFQDRWFESLPGTDGDGSVLLVGVIHDHPASVYRVGETVAATSPDLVALEAPPLAVPLFERHAERSSPSGHGGEMVAAARAADDARVVGVDAPSRSFLGKTLSFVRSERPSLERVAAVVDGTKPILVHALRYRVAALLDEHTRFELVPDPPTEFDVDADDPPATQADDERRQLSRSRSLLDAAELPAPVATLDRLREATMAAELRSLRSDGDVVAVVGQSHLAPLASRLRY